MRNEYRTYLVGHGNKPSITVLGLSTNFQGKEGQAVLQEKDEVDCMGLGNSPGC